MKKIKDGLRRIYYARQRKIERLRRKLNRKKRIIRVKSGIWSTISMPKILSIDGSKIRSTFLSSISKLRLSASANKNIRIDFSATETITAEAMLLLYAEVDRIVNSGVFTSKIKSRIRVPRDRKFGSESFENFDKVRQVLYHVGFLQLCGQKIEVNVNRSDVIHWKTASGKKSEGSKTHPMILTVREMLGQAAAKKYYTGMTEAMTNSHHHAYLEERGDEFNVNISGWWMFLQIKEDKLTVLICDLGIGIPRSLPRTHKNFIIEMLQGVVGAKDSACIDYAMQKGSTSTDMGNRGKGLKKMAEIVREVPESSLIIYSNNGFVKFKENSTVLRQDYHDSIMGTLITWSTKIPRGVENEGN